MKQKLILMAITMLLTQDLLGNASIVGADDVQTKVEVPDLWVGASQEDFSYEIAIEPVETEVVSDSIEEWKYPHEDLALFASVIYYEAGSLSREAQLMVGSVILNRMESNAHDWKNVCTIEEVVSQKHQYSTYKKAKRTLKTNDSCMEVAEWLLKNGTYDDTPLYQHYKHKVKGTTFYMKVDTEVFSY